MTDEKLLENLKEFLSPDGVTRHEMALIRAAYGLGASNPNIDDIAESVNKQLLSGKEYEDDCKRKEIIDRLCKDICTRCGSHCSDRCWNCYDSGGD